MGWEHLGTFSAPTSYNINIAVNNIYFKNWIYLDRYIYLDGQIDRYKRLKFYLKIKGRM